jgi:hypothetical protein
MPVNFKEIIMKIDDLKGLNTGLVHWQDGCGVDFSLSDLIEDWYCFRIGPFSGDKDAGIEKIFRAMMASHESRAQPGA